MSFMSLDTIKEYFDVNNSYVLKKLRIILFPVTIKVIIGKFDINLFGRVRHGKDK